MIEEKHLKYTLKATLLASFFIGNMLLPQQASAACRNLVSTDPYYSGWTYCCDLNTSVGHSYWIKRGGDGKKKRYAGSCERWGIKDIPLQPVCRNLRPGDQYYATWSRCCDEGKNKSRWFKRYSGDQQGKIYNGDCRSWTIDP